jgi:hypothetical protein
VMRLGCIRSSCSSRTSPCWYSDIFELWWPLAEPDDKKKHGAVKTFCAEVLHRAWHATHPACLTRVIHDPLHRPNWPAMNNPGLLVLEPATFSGHHMYIL